MSLPGLNVGIALRGLIQNSAKSTAKKNSFKEFQTPFNEAGDGFVLDRRSQKTSPTGRRTGEHEMISKSVSVSLLSNGLIKAEIVTNISQ